jgi:hypothetical protein
MRVRRGPMDHRVKPGGDEQRSTATTSLSVVAMPLRIRALPRQEKPSQESIPNKPPPLKKGGGAPRSAPTRSRIEKRCGARPLSCLPTAGGPRPPWTSKKWSGRARLSAPHRGIRGFCSRLGSGRASWNHRMQTGGPSPAPVQRAPRSPTRAGRDDAQAARERSVSLRPREPLPLRLKEYPRERRPFASRMAVM